jgi:hypothetical protein
MPLTTVQEGRVYDWSHAIGRKRRPRPGLQLRPNHVCREERYSLRDQPGQREQFRDARQQSAAWQWSPIGAITGFASSIPKDGRSAIRSATLRYCRNGASRRLTPTPTMARARRRVKSLEPQHRFCFPTAVEFDPATDSLIVADSQRNRLQIYKKVRDYSDFQANL